MNTLSFPSLSLLRSLSVYLSPFPSFPRFFVHHSIAARLSHFPRSLCDSFRPIPSMFHRQHTHAVQTSIPGSISVSLLAPSLFSLALRSLFLNSALYLSRSLQFDRKNPPPREGFLFTMFPDQENFQTMFSDYSGYATERQQMKRREDRRLKEVLFGTQQQTLSIV